MPAGLWNNKISRRQFCRWLAACGISIPCFSKQGIAAVSPEDPIPQKPGTNIADALEIPRTAQSLPGKYPARVVEVFHPDAVENGRPSATVVYDMLEKGMRELTGAPSLRAAWQQFVTPGDVIGLKVNPVAGPLLSTSTEITRAIITQLELSGLSRRHIVIWDRREFQLEETGFTSNNFPGIRITGTECKDEAGSFYNEQGRLHSEDRIDRDWYYWADCEMDYDPETLPYMVNQGKYSYFSRIVTRDIDKIINIPVLKNAGSSVTLCMKNLAYGSISNTARLHQNLWAETCAQVPCFPPLRDKVVLNIVDGIKGCYQGGPSANPQYICAFNRLLIGSDPVAVDRVGYELILQKRLAEKIQSEESPRAGLFMEMASQYQLGESDLSRITHQKLYPG